MSPAVSKPAYLPNPFHAALTTADVPFALVHGVARRFRPDIIPFAAVPEPSAEALLDLVPLLAPGEEVYVTSEAGETIDLADGLAVVSTLPGLQMRFNATVPADEEDSKVVTLGSEDVEEMIDLKARAFPGFFGPRAAVLGRFFGIRDAENGRLIAMGGERLATDTDREISALCTDPAYVGQGHAARIVRAVLRHQARLGTGSILHVTAANERAISLYEHLGFCTTGSIDFVKLLRV
jgi:ribosomal protein S18 acetylase RimI-like enzyme